MEPHKAIGKASGKDRKGWVIRIKTRRLGALPEDIFDVAIPDQAEAMEAVRKAMNADPDAIMEIVGELPRGTDLRKGEVLWR